MKLNRRILLLLALSFFVFAVICGPAQADQTYGIPLMGWSWDPKVPIVVLIPSSPKYAHDYVADTLRIWNGAQQWFAMTYFPNNATFTFVEWRSGESWDVDVRFLPSHTAYFASTPCPADSDTCASKEEVDFDMAHPGYVPSAKPNWMLHTSVHEFGHVLGLDHTSTLSDLMCGGSYSKLCLDRFDDTTPSTLDLYAVHLLANPQGSFPNFQFVTLPGSIPYRVNTPTTVSEFGNYVTVFMLTIGFTAFLKRKIRAPMKHVR